MSPLDNRKPQFAKKSLGQNFLVDKAAIAKIVGAVPMDSPLLLEIGPGRGALSTELFPRTKKFCVLEKDDLFAKNIGETLFVHGCRDHVVFHADALEFDWNRIWTETGVALDTPLVVCANLPYNVATEILFRLLDLRDRIPSMTLMFQKEVAQRIAAPCGKKDYGGISVSAQNFYDVRLQQILKPGAFRPSPKIDSAVLEFKRLDKPRVAFTSEEQKKAFTSLVRAAFSHRRKTIENSLKMDGAKVLGVHIEKAGFWKEALAAAGIDSIRRAETITIEEYGKLFQVITSAT